MRKAKRKWRERRKNHKVLRRVTQQPNTISASQRLKLSKAFWTFRYTLTKKPKIEATIINGRRKKKESKARKI
jgi:hypothetical protein